MRSTLIAILVLFAFGNSSFAETIGYRGTLGQNADLCELAVVGRIESARAGSMAVRVERHWPGGTLPTSRPATVPPEAGTMAIHSEVPVRAGDRVLLFASGPTGNVHPTLESKSIFVSPSDAMLRYVQGHVAFLQRADAARRAREGTKPELAQIDLLRASFSTRLLDEAWFDDLVAWISSPDQKVASDAAFDLSRLVIAENRQTPALRTDTRRRALYDAASSKMIVALQPGSPEIAWQCAGALMAAVDRLGGPHQTTLAREVLDHTVPPPESLLNNAGRIVANAAVAEDLDYLLALAGHADSRRAVWGVRGLGKLKDIPAAVDHLRTMAGDDNLKPDVRNAARDALRGPATRRALLP